MSFSNKFLSLKHIKSSYPSSSLLQRYYKGGMKTRGYDILSSMSIERTRQERSIANKPSIDYFEYEVQPANTSISLKKRMDYLQHLEYQDVEVWVQQFRSLAQESNWDEKTSLSVLKSIVDIKILESTKEYTSLDSILDALVRQKYPPEQINYIYLNIKNIKQNNFLLIKDYHKELQGTVKCMSFINNMTT
ncbi:hypothetical protein H311_00692, partial [Anncaliia algerae PRA109]